ncbi:fumarylacetoacetate hydrolase family protein [Nocardia zapadnayensis]|uniref:fumarylacetoacetate hydrolase family protein n=1 Tax=Nocardia rhamnosiphila TaxID=426716 RepID=UPI0022451684|nr:fumarylacetoacetate hydrolase family protein [Nocardia zapadnayensis]MCX0275203.1 fumarylacetoacetate hydrolase family protein [Nocardia zapadnayensis]
MRIANLSGRLVLVTPDGAGAVDVERASRNRFGPDVQAVFEQWSEFTTWAADADMTAAEPFVVDDLGAPVPAPRQVLAVGLNYSAHATESGFTVPDSPTVMFTKWASCLTGPVSTVELPAGGNTDWEVELVVVLGKRAWRIDESNAWAHVAGLTVGQDLSERITQTAGPSPQFSLGKSLPGFGPTGPWLVTTDELANPDDLEIGCAINGETVQKGRTRDLIFSVPAMIAKLSAKLPLLPGDLLFTGTPSGVGAGRKPPRFLRPGDELRSYITGIGELRQRFVAAPPA